MKLIIIRHGQTDANLQEIVQGGGVNLLLNDTGVAQANLVADKLKDYNFCVIYHSKLNRAVHTAKIISQKCKASLVAIDGLEEVSFGDAEGMKGCDAKEKYKDIFDIIHNHEHPQSKNVCVPNGETVAQSTARALKALNYIKENAKDEIVAVVTHGALMYNIYNHFFNQEKRFENCNFFELEI